MKSTWNENWLYLQDIKNTCKKTFFHDWVKNVILYNSKEAPDVEDVVQGIEYLQSSTRHYELDKNDYNFLTT